MSEHRSGGPISISIDVNGSDNQPEWGWCRAPECENEAMPIWFEGGPDGDPDLLLCPDCIGLEIVHLRSVIARVARQLPGNPDEDGMSSDLWRAVAQQRERTRALAEQDAAAWRQAAERLERQRDKTAAVNRELNAQLMEAERRHIRPWLAMLKDADDTANQLVSIALAHHANHQATLDTARRLAAAWRAERARSQALEDALRGLLDEPYGCALCDAGRLLSPAKMHMDECPYEIARALLNELEAGMYSGDEYYGDDVTSPLERPLFSGYKGGPLMNPLARIQKDTNMTPQEALDYINGARFANYSGQIVERRDGRDRYIVCEIGCNCSEIPGKISDEYGEALVTLLNSVEVLLAQQGTFTRMIAEVCDHNETLHNALRLIAKNEPSTLDVRGIARDALNAIKPIDADE